MGQLGFTPREVDEMLIWEIAVILRPKKTSETTSATTPTTSTSSDDERYRLLRQRYLHAKGLGPPPVVRPIRPEQLSALSQALS